MTKPEGKPVIAAAKDLLGASLCRTFRTLLLPEAGDWGRLLQGVSVLEPRGQSRLALLGLPSAGTRLAGCAGAADVI